MTDDCDRAYEAFTAANGLCVTLRTTWNAAWKARGVYVARRGGTAKAAAMTAQQRRDMAAKGGRGGKGSKKPRKIVAQ